MTPQAPDAPRAAAPGEATKPAAPIRGDLLCAKCGYNLRGLQTDGTCPECGNPIAPSLHSRTIFGDPFWLDDVTQGLRIMIFSAVASLVLIFLPPLAIWLWCSGIWSFTRRPKVIGELAHTFRWAWRARGAMVAVIADVVLFVLLAIGEIGGNLPSMGHWLYVALASAIPLLLGVTGFFLSMHVATISRHILGGRMAGQA